MVQETKSKRPYLHQLIDKGKFPAALELANQLIQRKVNLDIALHGKARVLLNMNRPRAVLDVLKIARGRMPDSAELHFLECLCLVRMERYADAISEFDEMLRDHPDHALGYYNRGVCQQRSELARDAIDSFDMALKFQPDLIHAELNRATAYLSLGNLSHGLDLFQCRWRRKSQTISRQVSKDIPEWQGQNISGKKIVAFGEQGRGDVIQFIRFAKLLRDTGADVTICTRPKLFRLLGDAVMDFTLVETAPDPKAYDFQIPLLDIARVLKVPIEDVGKHVPYLAAEPDRIAKWKKTIGKKGFKVGICWQGNPTSHSENGRSPPLELFRSLAEIEHVRLISLQKFDGLDQLANIKDDFDIELMPDAFDEGGHSFLDSAAAMKSLDLVITSDTAIAHLAGALGVPVWVVLKFDPDWRWLINRADSPWYPTARLFRQSVRSEWKPVFTKIAKALKLQVAEKLGGDQ